MLVFTGVLHFQENVEGTKHCKYRCFGHFWTPKRWYLRSFLPLRAPNPCKLQHFLPFLNRFFVLVNAKNAGIYAFFKKSKIMTWTKPCKKQCFSHFRGLKLWYLRGFLPADSAICCKLQHFVRCLCSIFKSAMLSHVLCIILHSSTRNNVADWNWREETHRSFYPHTQGLLHREVFTQRSFLHTEGFTQRSLYSMVLLQTNV